MPGTRSSRSASAASSRLLHDEEDVAFNATPTACADALSRSAEECARQRERLAKLISRHVGRSELTAAAATVDTCDLALEESVAAYEAACLVGKIPDETLRKQASTLWHAAHDYVRRFSSAEHASRLIKQHDAEALGDLQFEYELEASSVLALRHACSAYFKTRPEAA